MNSKSLFCYIEEEIVPAVTQLSGLTIIQELVPTITQVFWTTLIWEFYGDTLKNKSLFWYIKEMVLTNTQESGLTITQVSQITSYGDFMFTS